MVDYKASEVMLGLVELAEMMMDESLTSGNILKFKELLEQGLTIKQAQSQITFENSY